MAIRPGQIWQDIGASNPRKLEVISGLVTTAGMERVTLKNVDTGRKTTAQAKRFNGVVGGYKLVKDVE